MTGVSRLVLGLAALASVPATAQEVRNLDHQVARGASMDFQWLNYDEATCQDRGHVQLLVSTQPRLGRVSIRRVTVTQQTGNCAGQRLSVVILTYTAGRNPGSDALSFTVVGLTQHVVNVRFSVV